MNENNRVIIFDTTLRDGEQSPGATMNLSEKLSMAKQLERLGVDIIEAGFAAASPGDFEAVATIAQEMTEATVCSLARSVHADIDKAAEALRHAKKSRIHIFLATSPLHMEYKLKKTPEQVLRMTDDAVRYAASLTSDLEFSCEDASRSDMNFLVEVCDVAIAAGARTINIPDTVGYALPEEFGRRMATLIERVKKRVCFSVHCHNDLGLAVANSLAAVQHGARQVEVTLGGIGERAGNASLEEFVMALNVRKNFFNLHTGVKTERIFPSARRLYRIIGQSIARNKPILGSNVFAHESGIHQAGVLANPETYEIMTPESVGVPGNAIVFGKHSGRNAVKAKLEALGYNLNENEITIALEAIKNLADKKKDVFDEDLEALVVELIYRIPDKFRLNHLRVVSSDIGMSPTAMLKMEIDGVEHQYAGFGEGPIDAIFKSIAHVANRNPKLENYHVNAITGGSDALGEVMVRLSMGNKTAVGRGTHPDVMVASARAYVNALNRLEKLSEEK